MGKFLFFDIDGTLIGKSKMVTEKTKLAIQNARQNGHRAFLCTGRAPTSIVGDIRNIEFDGAIILNSMVLFVVLEDLSLWMENIFLKTL